MNAESEFRNHPEPKSSAEGSFPGPPDGNAVRPVEGPTVADRYRPLVRLVLTGCLIALCLLLAYPFLSAITWAIALAIIAWPLHAWLSRHMVRPWLSAGLTSFIVVAVVLVPLLYVSYQLVHEATAAAERMQQTTAQGVVRETMVQRPFLRNAVDWMERFGMDVDQEVRKLITWFTSDLAGVTQGSLAAGLQTLIAVFILYHLFLSRDKLMNGLRSVLPLSQAESDQVFSRAADSVYANLYANGLTSLIDGVGGGLVFWLLGLPAPVLWGTVLFVLSFLPAVGTAFLWIPTAGYLFLTGQWPQGLMLVGWGIVSGGIIGNILYIRLAGNRMRMHDVLALISYMGGVAIFGVAGIIIGPALFAVTAVVLDLWRKPAHKGPIPVLVEPVSAGPSESREDSS